MTGVGAGAVRHRRAVPADPKLCRVKLRQLDWPPQTIAAKPREQVIGARCVTINDKAIGVSEDHHVGQHTPLRRQQGAGAGVSIGQPLDIRCQDRLQEIRRFIPGHADHPAVRVMRHAACHLCPVRHLLSLTLPA